MNRILLCALCLFLSTLQAQADTPSIYDLIKEQMIVESVAEYTKGCPCPYSTAGDGTLCGNHSAWGRSGGVEPLCYANIIRDERLLKVAKEKRARHYIEIPGISYNAYNSRLSIYDLIRLQVKKDSLYTYPGLCACPFDETSRGNPCGNRSAYIRSGGFEPKCRLSDVSSEEVLEYLQTHSDFKH